MIEEFTPVSFTVSDYARFHIKLFAVVCSYGQALIMLALMACAIHYGWSLVG